MGSNGLNGAGGAGFFEFRLNGETVRVEGISTNKTLLDFLRERGWRGTKEGCAEGDCGACSVAILERDAEGVPRQRAINSCLALLPMVAGREIVTVEGIARQNAQCPMPNAQAEQKGVHGGNGSVAKSEVGQAELHPVQRALVERHGSQCGYCTPGFVVSMFEAYGRDDLTQRWQVADALCGNLCRCTGYRPIAEAAEEALTERFKIQDSSFKEEKAEGGRRKAEGPEQAEEKAMDYAAGGGRFWQPIEMGELLALWARHPEARLIAGATELGLDVNKKWARYEKLISVAGVAELGRVERTVERWIFGAAASLTKVEEALRADGEESAMAGAKAALLKMIWVFGARPIRNRATLGGNLVNASPIGDMAPVLMALGARVVLRSAEGGERVMGLEEFFTGYRQTAMRAGEVLCAIRVPVSRAGGLGGGTGISTQRCREEAEFRRAGSRGVEGRILVDAFKVSRRREMDISIVSAGFWVELDGEARVREARLAFGGVAATTVRARRTEEFLRGKVWGSEAVKEAAAEVLAREFAPISDVRASAEYRRGLVTSLWEKFCWLDGRAEFALDRRALAAPPALPPSPALPHESARGHVTGEARYVDDARPPQGQLETWPVCAPHARAKILRRDAAAARRLPGVRAVLLAEDIPGENEIGAVRKDEILLADKEVFFHGQLVAMVVGDTPEHCRRAAEAVVVEYEALTPILSVPEALAAGSFHTEAHRICRGDAAEELGRCARTIAGEFAFGGQEHFYLEGQVAWAEPGEDGCMTVQSSTQHPSEIQAVVAHVLDVPRHKVVVQSPRMGGGFGGKETQGNSWAALAALAARHTGRPVRVRLNRDQDMILTGKRHPFLARYEAGFTEDGMLRAARVELFANAGWSLDLSSAITDRALFHLDNGYYIPHVHFSGRAAKTNVVSNTAFRGFGGPQGMLVMEEIIDGVARTLGLPPEAVRERNLYRGSGETNTTHYGQEIGDNRLRQIWDTLTASSDFARRREEVAAWNAGETHRKRGLAITPVKFGISFTVSHLNQAGAHVLIYQDGSVQVNHGGTEMGQGLHTKMRTVAARELGVPFDQIRVMATRTDQVPNTSPTAASSGSDLNGQAVRAACVILRERLAPVAAELLHEAGEEAGRLTFAEGEIFHPDRPEKRVPFGKVAMKAYMARVSLAATGYYATPGIQYDHGSGRGTPFYYYACGAAACEVEVDGFTGAHRVLRVDILHDVGRSINEGVDRGQIEGAFTQGMGWLTCEELRWDPAGRLLTHAPSTYKIPSFGDAPLDFRVTLLPNAAEDKVIHGSKAVGEPPLMLAISVREALRDAVAAFGAGGAGRVELPSPATAEAIFLRVRERRVEDGMRVAGCGLRDGKGSGWRAEEAQGREAVLTG